MDRSIDRLKGDLLRHAGGDDPARLLPHRGLIPARALPVVAAHVEGVIDRDGPDPRRGAVRHSVLAERCDVQVIGFSDLAKFFFRPHGHSDYPFSGGTWAPPRFSLSA